MKKLGHILVISTHSMSIVSMEYVFAVARRYFKENKFEFSQASGTQAYIQYEIIRVSQ